MIELILFKYEYRKSWVNKCIYIYISYIYNVHVRYQQHSFLHVWNWNGPCFSKLSHEKEIPPRKKKVPCSSFGTASRTKTIQCRLKDPIWRTFTHYMVSKQMWHRNLPRRRPKRNAAPVSRVTWKEKKIMSNAILPETEQVWKDLTWNVKVPEKDNFWIRITSNMIVPQNEKTEMISHQMWKFLKKESYWKEIASNMLVPEKDKSEKDFTHQMWKFLKGKISEKKSHQNASNIMVPEKDKSEKDFTHQMWKFLKGKNSEKKSHHMW